MMVSIGRKIGLLVALLVMLMLPQQVESAGAGKYWMVAEVDPLEQAAKFIGRREMYPVAPQGFCVVGWGIDDAVDRLLLAADGKAALDEKLNELKRRLTSAEAEEAATNEQEQQAEHSIHLNVEESILPASCVDCGISLAIIDSPTCNDTTAYDNAIKVDLQDALKYKTDEKGSTNGWISQTFRERQLDGDGENADADGSAPAITLADVIAVSTKVIEAVNLFADVDYKIAVYLHDPNEEPVACAALEPASEEDAKMYEDMFFPTAAGNEGEEVEGAGGSDASVADPVPVGAMDSSSVELLISTLMVGMIMFMSVILLV